VPKVLAATKASKIFFLNTMNRRQTSST